MRRNVIAKILSIFTFTTLLGMSYASAGGSLYAPSNTWTGLYAGIHAGYADASFDGIFDERETNGEAFLEDLDVSGGAIGIHIGYNIQYSNLIFGIEGDISSANLDDSVDDRNDPFSDGKDTISADINYIASLRARIGFTTDSLMIYATGGVAYADASYTAFDANDSTVSETVEFDDIGYVIGAGIEKQFHRGLRLRVEGLYYSFDEKIDTGNGFAIDGDTNDFAEFEDIWSIRVGVSVPL